MDAYGYIYANDHVYTLTDPHPSPYRHSNSFAADHGFAGWQVGSANFSVLEHSEMGGKTKDAGRVMFNFETTTVKEEFERMQAAGAIVIREPYEIGGGWVATLADLDGNYFQLVTPMEQ